MVHPIQGLKKWHEESLRQFVLVPGALSDGQILTLSPQVLVAKAIDWITNPEDRNMPKDEGDLEALRHSFANCDEYVEGCEIETRPKLDENGFVALTNALLEDDPDRPLHEIWREIYSSYTLDW